MSKEKYFNESAEKRQQPFCLILSTAKKKLNRTIQFGRLKTDRQRTMQKISRINGPLPVSLLFILGLSKKYCEKMFIKYLVLGFDPQPLERESRHTTTTHRPPTLDQLTFARLNLKTELFLLVGWTS